VSHAAWNAKFSTSTAVAGDRWTLLAYLGICILLAAPFFLFKDIPLLDLPFHIARQHILFDPGLAASRDFYVPMWRPLPNLAMDLVVFVLHFFLSIDLSIRLFLAAIALQFFLGAMALNRALFGPGARFALFAALFAFNGPFMLGMVNMSFGIGMSLWVFALWIKWAERRHAWILFAALSSLILLAHLYAFAIYALVVSSYALGNAFKQPRAKLGSPAVFARGALFSWIKHIAHILIPIALYLAFMQRTLSDSGAITWVWADKIWGAMIILGAYKYRFDMLCLLAIVCGVALIHRQLTVARDMILPLAALVFASVALPSWIGQAAVVDARIPAAMALFLVASVQWKEHARARKATEIAVLALLALRMGVLVMQWSAWQPVYQNYRAAFRALPPGARVLPIGVTHWDSLFASEFPPLKHMDCLAVTEAGAFIPTMEAGQPYDLLQFSPAVTKIAMDFWNHPDIRDYDYVLVIHPEQTKIPPGLKEVARDRSFVLAQVPH
jgi:hypothetical protein